MAEIIPISLLKNTSQRPMIRARIIKIWPAIRGGAANPWAMNFVLLDDKGEAIQGLVPVDAYALIADRFVEGRLCELSRFTFVNADCRFQVVIHPFALRLGKGTLVRSLDAASYNIPSYILRPRRLEDIRNSITGTDQLVDIVARIAGFEDVWNVGGDSGQGRVRHMYVVNERDYVMEVALWDNFIDQFDTEAIVSQSHNSAVVVGCSSLQLRKFNEKYSLKTFLGTRFYFDVSIPEIAEFRSSLPMRSMVVFVGHAAMPHGFQSLSSASYERSDAKRVTLHELLQLASQNSSEKFACVAKITNVNTSFDWYYLSCPSCHRRAHENADKTFHYTYDNCAEGLVDHVPWYRFGVQVVDSTGDAEFVFLGRQAQLAVGVSASDLAGQDNPTPDDAPPRLWEIIGKRFLFTVTIKQMGRSTNYCQYTVSRVDPIPPEEAPMLLPSPGSILPNVQHQTTAIAISASPTTTSVHAVTPYYEQQLQDSSGLRVMWEKFLLQVFIEQGGGLNLLLNRTKMLPLHLLLLDRHLRKVLKSFLNCSSYD